MEIKTALNFDDKVRDKVSGYEGVITSIAAYKYRPAKFLLEPTTLKPDGDQKTSYWYCEGQLELVEPSQA